MGVTRGTALLGLALLACRDPTQMRLEVSTDLAEQDTRRAAVAFSFGSPDEAEVAEPATVYNGPWATNDGSSDPVGRIGDLVVVPSGAKNANIGMRIVLSLDGDPSECNTPQNVERCIFTRRRLRFIENETIRLPIRLYADCLGVECMPDTTCNYLKQCEPAEVPSQCLKNPDACQQGFGGGTGTDAAGGASNGTTTDGTSVGGATMGGTGGGGTGGTSGTGGGSALGPRVVLSVLPTLVDVGGDVVVDASATTDPDNDIGELQFAWDLGDSTSVPNQSQYTHQYAQPGSYPVVVTVTDPEGNSAVAARDVFVSDPNNALVVDTVVDESNIGATAMNPLGSGLSLREAILLANDYPGPDTIVMESTAANPYQLTASLPIVSSPVIIQGGVIDASGSPPGDCLQVESDDVLISGLVLTDCPGAPIRVTGGVNIEVSQSMFQDSSGSISIETPGARFVDNTLLYDFEGANGLTVSSEGVRIQGNLIVGYEVGIALEAGGDDAVIVHNTLVSQTTSAILLDAVSGADVRNNLLVDNGAFGLDALDSALAEFDYNLFFQNVSGDCSACTPGANSLLEVDPLFVDPGNDDYGLLPNSPAVDAGFDLGIDLNGSLPGAFNGDGSDIGHIETD